MTRALAAAAALMLLAGCWRAIPQGVPSTQPVRSATTRRIDDVTVHQFPNGLTLIHRRAANNEIAGAMMYARGGAADDADAQAGAAYLMARTLTKGTRTRTSQQLSEELGALGATLSAGATMDYCTLSLQCTAPDFAEAMELFADVVLEPTFPNEEVETERRKVLAQIRMAQDSNPALAAKKFLAALFGAHPYGRPIEGEAETVARLMPTDLAAVWGSSFAPDRLTLAVVANIPAERAIEIVGKRLGSAQRAGDPRYGVDKLIAPSAQRVEFGKESEQGYIICGVLTCPAGDPDEPALEVAAAVLGGGMSARLFTELRDRQGLAYSVGAFASFMQKKGYLETFIGTKPESIDHAADGLWAELKRLRDEPVSAEELARAKNAIAGRYLRAHERNLGQANYLAYWHVAGRGVDHDARYMDAINAVTTRDVMRVANKYFVDPTVAILRPEKK